MVYRDLLNWYHLKSNWVSCSEFCFCRLIEKKKPTHIAHICKSHKPTHRPKFAKECNLPSHYLNDTYSPWSYNHLFITFAQNFCGMETSYNFEDKELLQKVGKRIRHFRIIVGLSQEKLSFESDLDRTYIGSVERGERNIALINLNKLAKALNVSISKLLEIET